MWRQFSTEKSTKVHIFINLTNLFTFFYLPLNVNFLCENRLHIESKCGTVRCYKCKQCNSKFMTQNTLNTHMLIHYGEKKHLCNFCGNSFLSRGQLKIHERSHTKEKPYV